MGRSMPAVEQPLEDSTMDSHLQGVRCKVPAAVAPLFLRPSTPSKMAMCRSRDPQVQLPLEEAVSLVQLSPPRSRHSNHRPECKPMLDQLGPKPAEEAVRQAPGQDRTLSPTHSPCNHPIRAPYLADSVSLAHLTDGAIFNSLSFFIRELNAAG